MKQRRRKDTDWQGLYESLSRSYALLQAENQGLQKALIDKGVRLISYIQACSSFVIKVTKILPTKQREIDIFKLLEIISNFINTLSTLSKQPTVTPLSDSPMIEAINTLLRKET